MSFFGAAYGTDGEEWGKKIPLLGTVIPQVKKTQEIYKSRDTSLEFC